MPVISTAIAALGTLATSVGTAAATTGAVGAAGAGVGAISSAATAIGAAAGLGGTILQAREASQAARAQREQEAIRKKQADFEFARARREVIRQTQIARATGLNVAAQSGGELPTSSVLGGIMGQYANNEAYQLTSIAQNQNLSDQTFASNAEESQATGRASLFGSATQFGSILMNNNQQLGRIGASLFNA